MREPWLVFLRNGEELLAYTLRGTFPGEAQETIKLLAFENGCEPAEITTTVVNR